MKALVAAPIAVALSVAGAVAAVPSFAAEGEVPGTAIAVGDPSTPQVRGTFSVGAGSRLIDVEALNETLVRLGYEGVSGIRGVLAFVLQLQLDRFVLEAGLDWLPGDREPRLGSGEDPPRVTTGTRLSGVTGSLGLGYALLSSHQHHLGSVDAGVDVFPLVTFGGGTVGVEVRDGAPRDAESFNDQLGAPYDNAALTRDTLGLSFGGGLDFRLGTADPRGELDVGAVLGVRAGYHSDVYGDGWYVEEQPLGGGPDLNLSGPFFRLLLGIYYGDR